MTRKPPGRVEGKDLIITRTFRAPIEDVWTSVTNPENTARWIGPWKGEPGVGKTIHIQLVQEQGAPWSDSRIDACEPPRHLALTTYGDWRLELTLEQRGEVTELVFVHHMTDRELAGDAGPGWEFYLDCLVASRDGQPLSKFEEYYPAQKPHYLAQ
jgi:uncharacterized protein YndB with AHSA1/START domain